MRPFGVTLIALYQFLRGVLGLLFALGITLFGSLAARLASLAAEGSAAARFLQGFGNIVGLVIALFCVLSLVAGFGLLKMANWARLLTMLLSALAVVMLLPVAVIAHGLPLFAGLVNAAVILYLAMPPVKRAFKARMTASATA
jgi:hypothetical protein